jgi:glycosyltransferase involved in cell wall biosynthesis/SAM-dependent methyltransferase
MDVCSIIARNYLAAARVLADSLREHHPEVRFHLLVIDDPGDRFDPEAEPFEVLRPQEIGLPDFERMAGLYEIIELSTAVKPWLLRHLLERSEDGRVMYLDPDIRLYDRIDDVFEAIGEHGLVLNPHNTEPIPRDGRKPAEEDILIAGAYNLGFIGLGRGEFADFLLDWWSERLESHCIVDPQRGFFVDQRWIDLVPGLTSDYELIRDPGFNLAYWNLATRKVERDGDGYLVNGAPLRLFHFSGFDPRQRHMLSKHQDRIRLADEPALAELCADYADALWEAGHEEASEWPYGYAETHGGIPLKPLFRMAYREAVMEDGVGGSLFTADGEREFLDWCNGPGEGVAGGLTRFLKLLYETRVDLQLAYRDLRDPATARGLLDWATIFGSHEVPIPDALLPGGGAAGNGASPSAPAAPAPPLGVNVAGYLRAELGVGEVARQLIGALDAQRVPVLPVGLHAPNSRAGHDFGPDRRIAAPFDVNLVCVNADGLPAFAAEAGPEFFEGRHSIGVWWWELSEFPEQWRDSFELVDEIWVGSRFVADALAAVSPIPVMALPLPVSAPEGVTPDRAALGLPDGFLFLFSFDYNSVFRRKNPLAAVEAFARAFGPDDGVALVVKSINHERDPDSHDRLRLAAAPHPHVHLISDYLPAADKERLTASCDAYLSLHRAEGFGIGMAEAMLQGKPVVATGYGGNADFLDESTGYPVRYEIVEVGEGAWPYDPAAHWAEPDVEHAAAQLRRVVERPEEAAARARRGAELIRERHSPATAGERMVRRLEAIRARRAAGALPAPVTNGARPRRRLARAPAALRARLGRVRRRAPAAVRRLARPAASRAAALEALRRQNEELRAEVAEVRTEAALAQATDLAELRRLRTRMDAAEEAAREVERLRRALVRQEVHLREGPTDPALAADLALDLGPYPEAPAGEPWSEEYTARHRELVARELDDPLLVGAFRAGERLPDGFGTGFDERVVELPWIAAQRLGGTVLDAGSTLNHTHVLARLRPRMDDLHIVTLAPEADAFPQLHVSYLFADLRDLPIADERYDRVVSISTLEHVGMDNDYYGTPGGVADDPQRELLAAVRELRRVLKPGGDLYVTVPVGEPDRFAWVRSLSVAEVDQIADAFEPAESAAAYYRHHPSGWQLSDRDGVAGARYRDHFTSGPVGDDRVVAAGAVACLHLVR